jgi:hypothetical protein
MAAPTRRDVVGLTTKFGYSFDRGSGCEFAHEVRQREGGAMHVAVVIAEA